MSSGSGSGDLPQECNDTGLVMIVRLVLCGLSFL
jgi:hypothetical protein